MVYQTGLKIQRFFSVYTINLFAASLKNMENILQQSATHDNNKSDIGTQFSEADSLKASQCDSDDQDENCKENPGALANKRKIIEIIEDEEDREERLKRAKLQAAVLRPGFSAERFNETSYYFENGLRKVYPYNFTFTTYTKGRWVGKTLVEVFGKEFRAHSLDEYERHIEKGFLTINNLRVTPDYVLKHNDLLANIVHRHEVPVKVVAIEIIHLDNDILVINKPASIPVHPCGRYRHNTIIFLMAKEYNLKDLKTIHRLDRLTSGILMFGRSQKRTRMLEAQMRDRQVIKEYVSRVEGKFPESVECDQPIRVVSFKIGVCKVSPEGKSCSTSFRLLSYDEGTDTSVVLCKPTSGRMHQIRVHLQYLGYPIKNDPLYNDTIFGPEKGRGGNFGKTDEQLVEDLIRAHNAENWLKTDEELPFQPGVQNNIIDELSTETPLEGPVEDTDPEAEPPAYINMYTQTGMDLPDMKMVKSKLTIDPYCQECKIQYKDPKPKDLIMYLHAYKYSGPGWAYECPMPEWADVNWKEPQ